jgi:hypothetical protein
MSGWQRGQNFKMKSLLKIMLVASGISTFIASVVVIVQQSRQPHIFFAAPEGELPAAISNYSKTFKLNTNPPIWTTSANGRNTTN